MVRSRHTVYQPLNVVVLLLIVVLTIACGDPSPPIIPPAGTLSVTCAWVPAAAGGNQGQFNITAQARAASTPIEHMTIRYAASETPAEVSITSGANITTSVPHTYPANHSVVNQTYEVTVTVEDSTNRSATASITVTVAPDLWKIVPDLQLTAPSAGTLYAPLVVTLDATGSSEQKQAAAITGFDWDLNNDGTYEIPAASGVQQVPCVLPDGVTDHSNYAAQVNVHSDKATPGSDNTNVAWTVLNPAQLELAPVAPPALKGSADITLTFTNHRTETDNPPAVVRIEWDFEGDGTVDQTDEPPTPSIAGGNQYTIVHNYAHNDADGTNPTTFNPTVGIVYDGYPGNIYQAASTFSIDPDDFVNLPPEAVLVPTSFSGTRPAPGEPYRCTFDASTSHDPDNGTNPGDGIVKWEWTINIDADPVVWVPGTATHEFSFDTAGVYNIGVRVTDDDPVDPILIDTATGVVTVTNELPQAALNTSLPRIAHTNNLTVTFDATGSTDADGYIDLIQWDFDGDGVYSEAADPVYGDAEEQAQGNNTPVHTYTAFGKYDASVKVIDQDGGFDTAFVPDPPAMIILNEPPVASLFADKYGGAPPLPVVFTAADSVDPTPGGSIVDYEWDFDGDGVFNSTPEEIAAKGQATPSAYEYTASGIFHPAVKVTDNDGGTGTASCEIIVNNPPVAKLDTTPDPATGQYDLAVQFDASGSTDADGAIADYEWDFDGDGNYNEDADPVIGAAESICRGDNTPAFVYAQAMIKYTTNSDGRITAAVRVTDNLGGQHIGTKLITLLGWPPTADYTLTYDALNPDHDVDLNVSVDPSLSFDDPAEPGNSGIVSYALNWGDGTQETFDNNSVRNHTYIYPVGMEANSLGLWQRTFTLTVTDVDGLTSTKSEIIDLHGWRRALVTEGQGGDVGLWSSMKMVDGQPAVCYYDKTNGRLMYMRSSATVPVADFDWSASVIVDDGFHDSDPGIKHDVGAFCSMTMTGADHYPAIAYYDATSTSLCYLRALDPLGNIWPADPVILDTDVRGFISLAEINFNPAITYVTGATNGVVKFIRGSDPTGIAAWNLPAEVDSTGGVNGYEYTSLCSVEALPAVLYRDVDNNDLLFIRAVDANGTDWSNPAQFVQQNYVGIVQDCKLTIVEGRPAVVYHNYIDDNRRNVIYLQANDASGSTWDYATNAIVVGSGRYPELLQSEAGAVPWVSFYQYTAYPVGRLVFAKIDPAYFLTDAYGRTQVGVESIKLADPVTDRGLYSSMLALDVSGTLCPAITYYDKTSGDLRYCIYR